MAEQTEIAPKKEGTVVVSVINLKGGVGKTTITALLARYAIEEMGLGVLAVDLDPQANLSQALMKDWEYEKFLGRLPDGRFRPSIVDIFKGYAGQGDRVRMDECVYKIERWKWTDADPHHLIPSRFNFADYLIEPLRANERALAEFINKDMSHKDLILIDCAPTESVLTRAAYHASSHILVPVKTELFSVIGFPLLRQSLRDFEEQNPGHDIKVCGVLINRSGATGEVMERQREKIRARADQFDWPLMPYEMRFSTGFQKWPEDLGHLGKYMEIFRPIAMDFMEKVGLHKRGERI